MRGPYEWSTRSYSYRSKATGRYVSAREVRTSLDEAIRSAEKRMDALAQRLQARTISVSDWQTAMAREIKNVHAYSAAAAKGGWAQMTPADWGRTGARVKEQYRYLAARAEAIASGAQPLDGTLRQRARMYAQAARATYHATEAREMGLRGFREERNVRNASDSCDGPGSCIGETARGWVDLGQLIPIGSRRCKVACKCYLTFRNPDTGAVRRG